MQELARNRVNSLINGFVLCDDDRTVLANAAAVEPSADARTRASYGPLVPANFKQVEANGSIIAWAALCVAKCLPLKFIGSDALEASTFFIHSQTITSVLSALDRVVHGQSTIKKERARLLASKSLAAFFGNFGSVRVPVSSHRRALIDSAPHWRAIMMPVHHPGTAGHWSLAILRRQLDESGPLLELHDSLAGPLCNHPVKKLLRALTTFGFVDPATQVAPQHTESRALQPGSWQCGYAVIARIIETSARGRADAKAALGDDWSARRTIASREHMQLFIEWLVARESAAHVVRNMTRRASRGFVIGD